MSSPPDPLPSDEAVEAAARDAFWRDDMGGHIKGRWTWDTIPDEGRENYRTTVRAALTAAYAIDMPRREAEVRAATLREISTWLRDEDAKRRPAERGMFSQWLATADALERAHFNQEAE